MEEKQKPQFFSQEVDQYNNMDCLLQTITYPPDQEDTAQAFVNVCEGFQETFPGCVKYLEVDHDQDNATIMLRLNYLDHAIPLSSLMHSPYSNISAQLIINVMFKLVEYFAENIQKRMFNACLFNADCVLLTQLSENDQNLFLLQISCFPIQDAGNNSQDKPFDLCAYENSLNEEQIVSALLELVRQFSAIQNVIFIEDKTIINVTKGTEFQSNLLTLANQKLKTLYDLQRELEVIKQQYNIKVDTNELSDLIQQCLCNSLESDQSCPSRPLTMKVKQFMSMLETNFKVIIPSSSTKTNTSSEQQYHPISFNLNGNILQLQNEKDFYCEVMHMVILYSFLEENNQDNSQVSNASMTLRSASLNDPSFFRKNFSFYYEYGRQKDKLDWVFIGILIHFVNSTYLNEDLKTSIAIVLLCLEVAQQKPQEKEDDFMKQYLTPSFRYHLENVARNLDDKYLEKTSKYFQLKKGIQQDQNSKMIEFNSKEYEIKIPKKLLESLTKNEIGEICFKLKEENSSS